MTGEPAAIALPQVRPVQPTPPAEITSTAWFQGLAVASWQRGQAALIEGDVAEAMRWLERAHRIAPADIAISFALASACARAGIIGQAVALLDQVSRHNDIREVWLSLATMRHRIGAPEAAATALARALSGHALPPSSHLPALAGDISAQSGHPGWCAFLQDGELVVHPPPRRRVTIGIDGAPARHGRRIAATTRRVDVTLDGEHLLGSPIRVADIRKIEGIVRAAEGGIEGWAWHPGAPELDPELSIRVVRPDHTLGRVIHRLRANDQDMIAPSPMSRPRRFRIDGAALAGVGGMIAVTALDGRHLAGSPLAPFGERDAARAAARAVAGRFPATNRPAKRQQSAWPTLAATMPADIAGPPVHHAPHPDRPVAVVVPVHGGIRLVDQCLRAVLATLPAEGRVIVVDDASPEPEMADLLDAITADPRVSILRHAANRGFPGSANTGMRAAMALRQPHDVVLLNSDTVPPPGWIEALRAIVHGAPDIGSATPFSNDATILSYPDPVRPNPVPDRREVRRWARWAAQANAGVAIDIPTAVGFCMYLRRECLADAGLFREDLFAQGYGEENDLCIRARHLGWRHVAAPGVFVAHVGGQSFGAARTQLIARNLDVLERAHPGYHRLIADFAAADPLAPARQRYDIQRWRAGRLPPGAVLLITHDSGGGVERVIRERCVAIRAAGQRPIVLRSTMKTEGTAGYLQGLCRVEDGGLAETAPRHPNLRFHLPGDLAALTRFLRGDKPQRIELHHLLGHDHSVRHLAERLRIPFDIFVHDYAAFCPRISLVGRDGRYCGEPDNPAVCEACVRDAGAKLAEPITVRALRARSAADLRKSTRIVVPAEDVAARMRRHFHGIEPEIEPLEDDTAYPPARPLRASPTRIAVIGGIGVEKGYDVLLACARNAAARHLNLHFTVIGHTPDDDRLIETGHVFVTGPYKEAQVVQLIRGHDVQMAWQPSIWPETWCFTLGIAWRAGLHVAAFDIGAVAERIRRTGRGWLLPLGLPSPAINSAFAGLRHEPNDISGAVLAYQRQPNTV